MQPHARLSFSGKCGVINLQNCICAMNFVGANEAVVAVASANGHISHAEAAHNGINAITADVQCA